MDHMKQKEKMKQFEELILIDVLKTISLLNKDRFTVKDIIATIETSDYYDGLMKVLKKASLASNINSKLKPWRDISVIIELPKDSKISSNNEHVYKVSQHYLDLIAKRKLVDHMKMAAENSDLAEGKVGSFSELEKSLDLFNDSKMHLDDLSEEMIADKAVFIQQIMKDNADDVNARIRQHKKTNEDIKTIYDLPQSKKVVKNTHNEVLTKMKQLLKLTIKERELAFDGIEKILKIVNSDVMLNDIDRYTYLKHIKNTKESLEYLS